jgi:hypothetical protein
MTDSELDAVYTRLCTTLTQLGEPLAALYLARFALLAMTRLGDPVLVNQLIDAAAAGLADRKPE